ncbi:hypothetical protein IDG52_01565 [Pelagibacterales bacterium SAG-MED23]|nr:hypothetical protein [Pelagibacterales bacterium SAG-MED23]
MKLVFKSILSDLPVNFGLIDFNSFLFICSPSLLCKIISKFSLYFAGYQIGVFKSLDQIKRKWKKEKIFTPNINKKLRNKLLNGWKLAVDRTLL